MVPFFADILDGIVRDLLEIIFLKDVLRKAINLYQLVQIILSDKNIRKSAADIGIGFAANIKVEESNLSPNDFETNDFLLLKKKLETSLLHCCHTFLKSRHGNIHLFEVLHF